MSELSVEDFVGRLKDPDYEFKKSLSELDSYANDILVDEIIHRIEKDNPRYPRSYYIDRGPLARLKFNMIARKAERLFPKFVLRTYTYNNIDTKGQYSNQLVIIWRNKIS